MSSTVDTLRDNIADYVFDRLGSGIVDVELDKKHIDTAINRALQRYRQRAQNSVEESYLVQIGRASCRERVSSPV